MPTPLYKKYKALPVAARQRMEGRVGMLAPTTVWDLPFQEFLTYACTDPCVTYQIEKILSEKVVSMGLQRVMEIDHSVIPMVADMMSRGMLVDKDHFLMVQDALTELMGEKAGEITSQYPIDNIGSDDQVADLLFNVLHLPYLYMTDSGKRPSVDKETLDSVAPLHPVAGKIREWRELETLLTTFAIPLYNYAVRSPDGRIHPNILLTRQPSGRFSVKEPNLLAIPTRTPMGRLIREGFIPTPGYSFVSVDFSQLECRILAHLSNDPNLCQVFHSGIDPFRATAAQLWGVKPEDVSKEDRDVTKNNFYGIIYGITPQGLSFRLCALGLTSWTPDRVAEFQKEFFDLYSKVRETISSFHAEARSTGGIRDMFGRVRLVPQVRSTKKHVREEGLRQAQNHPMQSSASGIMKLAMKEVWDTFGPGMSSMWGESFWSDLQIHDELLFESITGMHAGFGDVMKLLMESAIELRVPLKAKWASSDQSWGAIEK